LELWDWKRGKRTFFGNNRFYTKDDSVLIQRSKPYILSINKYFKVNVTYIHNVVQFLELGLYKEKWVSPANSIHVEE
jgi:hypothetical protein